MSDEPSWSSPAPLPDATGDCHDPAIAVAGDVVHFVWVRERLLHHARLAGDRWLPAVRFAAGEQPVLSVDPDGMLHCVFANWFLGNCEIHHIEFDGDSWGFPEWVSRTPGPSVQPALAWARDGEARIVWSEDMPDRPLIYYGGRGRVAWLHSPIPNLNGSRPSIAVAASGDVYVAWQDRLLRSEGEQVVAGPYRVLAAVLSGDRWSIPEVVSEASDTDAVAPALCTTPDGGVHIAWQEEQDGQFVIKYAIRLPQSWSRSVTLSDLGVDSRLPRVVSGGDGLHVLWVDGSEVRHRQRGLAADAAWSGIETVANAPEISEMDAAAGENGQLSVVWSVYETGDRRCIRYTKIVAPAEYVNSLPFVPGAKR